jgi:hypothetical protein
MKISNTSPSAEPSMVIMARTPASSAPTIVVMVPAFRGTDRRPGAADQS